MTSERIAVLVLSTGTSKVAVMRPDTETGVENGQMAGDWEPVKEQLQQICVKVVGALVNTAAPTATKAHRADCSITRAASTHKWGAARAAREEPIDRVLVSECCLINPSSNRFALLDCSSMTAVLNFGAGPAKLPREVLEVAQKELLDWHGLGMSLMELSHRSNEFQELIKTAEQNLRTLMGIPANYKVLFVQGGGSTQFSVVPLNLSPGKDAVVDYIVTGAWSQKAAAEAKKYATVNIVNADGKQLTDLTKPLTFSSNASYVYYCANETIHGVEFAGAPDVPAGTVLVADMSSNILSRHVDVSKFGLIFAGAQKNIGCSGVTIVIVRDDLLGRAQACCPEMLDLSIHAKNGSLYNTPPTWSIYIAGLVFAWVLRHGGVPEFDRRSADKAALLYGEIDGSAGFYTCPVQPEMRSRMNVPFRIRGGDAALEKAFLAEAEQLKMQQLAGHRSVGGIRASIYNAIEADEVQALVAFMASFRAAHA
eukprot:m.212136 g.212136  ORF g.212136 m.212136 type:complete len:482 (+) comp10141_c0_seq2:2106-3551(+)